MCVTWGAAWAGAGLMMAVATGFPADAPFPLVFGVFGVAAGVLFDRGAPSIGSTRAQSVTVPLRDGLFRRNIVAARA